MITVAPSIELLWWEGCPSTPKALEELRAILREEGLDPNLIQLREIETDQDARREHFVGSPTIRIDGEEVQAPGGEAPLGLTCRIYRLRDGRPSPTPDPADIRELVARQRAEGAEMAESTTPLSIGDTAPDFELPDTDGGTQSLSDGSTPAVVVFTCNHCPYALAWHDRILQAGSDYADRGVRFLLINPNDARCYPGDSFEAMKNRVQEEGGWPAPYLRDESQKVARAYGAQTTPDVFVVDSEGRLRYRGAPDADYQDDAQNAAWLREALDAVLAGRDPERPETKPVGCSVKWT